MVAATGQFFYLKMCLLGDETLNLTCNFLYQLSFSDSSDEDSYLSIYSRACQHAKEVSFQVESFLGFVSSLQVSTAELRVFLNF